MRCPNCGYENEAIRLFCFRCGEVLPEREEEREAPDRSFGGAPSPDLVRAGEPVKTGPRPGDRKAIPPDPEDLKPEGFLPEGFGPEAFGPEPDKPEAFEPEDFRPEGFRQEDFKSESFRPGDSGPEASTPKDLTRKGSGSDAVPEDRFREEKQERIPIPIREKRRDPPEQKPAGRETGPEERLPGKEAGNSRPVRQFGTGSLRTPVVRYTHTAGGNTQRADTHIPYRDPTPAPEEFFSVKGQVAAEEPEERSRRKKPPAREPEEAAGGFLSGHIRGTVAIVLLLVTAAVMLIWAQTDSAQLTLARVDLAWKADAYEKLGDMYAEEGEHSSAAHSYLEALERRDEIRFALKAANEYIAGDHTEQAIGAVRECIRICPSEAEYYVRLIELRGGTDHLTAEEADLVREGYRRTGDERLAAVQ